MMICIIGGGIAGLYAAKRLIDAGTENVVILEAEKTVGGRARMARFRGIPVVRGAGIGRARDRRLRRLLREFGIPENRFRVKVLRGKSLPDLARRVRESREYRAAPRAPFGKLAAAVLGKKRYAAFLEKSLYTNFERDDATDVILDYGVNDNGGGWTGLAVSWTALIRALEKKVGSKRIVTETRATAIERLSDGSFVVRTDRPDGFSVRCETVVLATTVDVVRRLLPNIQEYRGIFGQSFIRVYAAFDAPSAALLRSLVPAMTIVPRPLKKIIPMTKNKNVFMIAYADNADAEAVHAIETDAPLLARMVAEAVDAPGPLRILDVQSHYWPIGTHGFGPLSKKYADRAAFLRAAQRPSPGVFVVGEMVSTNQGWVEGALESVDAVFEKIKKENVTL
jgi:2-polyprenyl-6-methoxyphenol hydroxylase-like FAD-dependent oxidoreductase